MINQNVSDANSNFDKTVYDFETFARVEVTPKYSVVLNPLSHDVIQVGKELGLPQGKHLVRLIVTAEVMKSEPPDADSLTQYSNAPDDLAQETIGFLQAAFQQANGKVATHSGVTDMF